tara:strand:+ start:161 stop:586 length:426 start_codon:yes stop_codon:yes gene_type:complete
MAHYAFIDDNSVVTQVIVGIDEDNTEDLPEGFATWEAYYESLEQHSGTCIRTSYNTFEGTHLSGGTPFRGNYAGLGMKYDTENDVFYWQQPYSSWTLNTTTWIWEPPVPYPALTEEQQSADEVTSYEWNEETTNWVLRTPE